MTSPRTTSRDPDVTTCSLSQQNMSAMHILYTGGMPIGMVYEEEVKHLEYIILIVIWI